MGARYCGAADMPEPAALAQERGLALLWDFKDRQDQEFKEFQRAVSHARMEENHSERVRRRAVASERDTQTIAKLLDAWTLLTTPALSA